MTPEALRDMVALHKKDASLKRFLPADVKITTQTKSAKRREEREQRLAEILPPDASHQMTDHGRMAGNVDVGATRHAMAGSRQVRQFTRADVKKIVGRCRKRGYEGHRDCINRDDEYAGRMIEEGKPFELWYQIPVGHGRNRSWIWQNDLDMQQELDDQEEAEIARGSND